MASRSASMCGRMRMNSCCRLNAMSLFSLTNTLTGFDSDTVASSFTCHDHQHTSTTACQHYHYDYYYSYSATTTNILQLLPQHTPTTACQHYYYYYYLLPPFNGLFSRTTWISWYQKGKTSLDLNEARHDGVFGTAVASAGPYANNLHLATDR